MAPEQKGVEQVALSHLLDNAYEEFQQSLSSVGARFVLWGSFDSAEALKENYFRAKKKEALLDRRRGEKSRTNEENQLISLVEDSAESAYEYVEWAKKHSSQPIMREMLTSYCTAFEACLKNTALVFAIASKKKQGIEARVFVPGDEFKRFLDEIKNAWKLSGSAEKFRAKTFFDEHVRQKNPSPDLHPFLDSSTSTHAEWEICRAAFNLRNAIVHQLGRSSEQETIGSTIFPARWEIELNSTVLSLVSKSMRAILSPLGVNTSML